MKKIIKTFIPAYLIRFLFKVINITNSRYGLILKANKYRARFKKTIFADNNNELIKSHIIMLVHSIEKGFSHKNIKAGFGKNKIYLLIDLLVDYIDRFGYEKSIELKMGISILKKYNEFDNHSLIDDEFFLKLLSVEKQGIDDYSGLKISSNLISKRFASFRDLMSKRVSSRSFSGEKVKDADIVDSINIANLSPSSCNRQPWKVVLVSDQGLIREILNLQGGFNNFGEGIDRLLIILNNNNSFHSYMELYQGYVDCGLFSMSLVLAFTEKNIATCMLNASLTIESEKKLRKLLKITNNLEFIMFIAIGIKEENSKHTLSFKFPAESTIIANI